MCAASKFIVESWCCSKRHTKLSSHQVHRQELRLQQETHAKEHSVLGNSQARPE